MLVQCQICLFHGFSQTLKLSTFVVFVVFKLLKRQTVLFDFYAFISKISVLKNVSDLNLQIRMVFPFSNISF